MIDSLLITHTIPKKLRQGSAEELIKFLWENHYFSVGEMAENVTAAKAKLTKQSRGKKGSDYTDESEHKYLTVRYRKTDGDATINGLGHKIGLLRARLFEPRTGKTYFFLIPHKIYSKAATVKICFNLDGSPKMPRTSKYPNWWNYSVTMKEYFQNFQ
jgi:hypothetical protein